MKKSADTIFKQNKKQANKQTKTQKQKTATWWHGGRITRMFYQLSFDSCAACSTYFEILKNSTNNQFSKYIHF